MGVGMMAAPLSDGRLQVWLTKSDGSLWTFWKEGTNPDSGWTPWQKMPETQPGMSVGAVAPLSNGALQLFVISKAGFTPPYQSGPNVLTNWKVGSNSTAAWSGWRGFWGGKSSVDGGTGAVSVAAVPLTDGRIQVFIVESGNNVSRLITSWKETTNVNAAWAKFIDFTPPGVGPGFAYISRIAACRLSDGRPQIFATAGRDVWTTWKVNMNPNAAWAPWQRFYSSGSETDYDTITAASLSDGRPQLWRLNRQGSLSTRWKEGTNPNAAWTQWTLFSAPGKHPVAFTAGPLSDGHLQLWVVDKSGVIHTRWKTSRDPNAAWTPWNEFPHP